MVPTQNTHTRIRKSLRSNKTRVYVKAIANTPVACLTTMAQGGVNNLLRFGDREARISLQHMRTNGHRRTRPSIFAKNEYGSCESETERNMIRHAVI